MRPEVGDRVEVIVPGWMTRTKGIGSRMVGTVVRASYMAALVRGTIKVGAVPPGGACNRCNRPIWTGPSLALGFGPDCAEQLGLSWLAKQKELSGQDIARATEQVQSAISGEWWLPFSRCEFYPIGSAPAPEVAPRPVEPEPVVPAELVPPLDLTLPPGLEPMPFQWEDAALAYNRKRMLLGHVPGLGKTIISLLTISQAVADLRRRGVTGQVLVICPATLKANWLAEAKIWVPHLRAQVISGLNAKISKKPEILICNYDILAAGWRKNAKGKPIVGQVKLSKTGERLRDAYPSIVVLDESHACKGDSQRRYAVNDIAHSAEYRLLLSGTAVLNRPLELVAQLGILGCLESHFNGEREFKSRYCDPKLRQAGSRLVWDYSGSSHLRELHQKLQPFYIRRRKEDVLKDLPPKRFAKVSVELSNRAEYDRLEAAVADALPEQRLGMMTQVDEACGMGKIAAAIEHIESFVSADEPLVVFAKHISVQRALCEKFPQAAHILGADSPAKREAAKQRFQTDPNCKLIICSLKAAAEGITLTKASNLLLVELDYVPGRLTQAVDRIHRIGQVNNVVVWTLVADESMDQDFVTMLANKRIVTGQVLDGAAEVQAEQNVRREAVRHLIERVKGTRQKETAA